MLYQMDWKSFINSFQFQSSSLDSFVKYLGKDDLKCFRVASDLEIKENLEKSGEKIGQGNQ